MFELEDYFITFFKCDKNLLVLLQVVKCMCMYYHIMEFAQSFHTIRQF